jgi:hypothetical protein
VNRAHKKPPFVNHASYHQIPVIINQCDLLSKREYYELMARESMGTHELKAKNEIRDTVQMAKNKHVQKKHKIIVTGYSHAQGCAAEIKLNLDDGFKGPRICKSRYRGKYYHNLCKYLHSTSKKTRCDSSMGRLKGCGKKIK